MAGVRTEWSWANAVTTARVAIAPVVVLAVLLETAGWRWVAVGLFVVAAGTDRLDGWLARRLDQVTDWGKLVDPIADKALIGGTLVALSWLGEVSWWVTGVILARELGITLVRLAVLRYVVIPASRGGKLKTVLQSVGVGLALLPLRDVTGLDLLTQVVLWAAVVVTVVTGADYVRRGWQVRAAAPIRTP